MMMGLQIKEAAKSDQGRMRNHQEDAYAIWVPTDPDQMAKKGALFIVADGVGGHQAGDIASRMAVEIIVETYYSSQSNNIGESLRAAIIKANDKIFLKAQELAQAQKMATTVVCAIIRGQEILIAHVGDSRAYLLRSEKLELLTSDHSWVNERVRQGILTNEQAENHPKRHVITRSLGHRPLVDVEISQPLDLWDGDRYLLCTDGLYEEVDEQTINAEMHQSPQIACDRLIELANISGGHDNITVLLVEVNFDSDDTRPRTVEMAYDEDIDDEITAIRPVYDEEDAIPWAITIAKTEKLVRQLWINLRTIRAELVENWSALNNEIEMVKKAAAPQHPLESLKIIYEHSQYRLTGFEKQFEVMLPSNNMVVCGAKVVDWQTIGNERIPKVFRFGLSEISQDYQNALQCIFIGPGNEIFRRGIPNYKKINFLVVSSPGVGVQLKTKNIIARFFVLDVDFLTENKNTVPYSCFQRLEVQVDIESIQI